VNYLLIIVPVRNKRFVTLLYIFSDEYILQYWCRHVSCYTGFPETCSSDIMFIVS